MLKYRDETVPYIRDFVRIINVHDEINQDAWFAAGWDQMNDEWRGEAFGIVKALDDPVVTAKNLILFGMMYEMGSPMGCSEVVAAAPDGTVLHGRNLDYKEVSPTIEVSYVRNGKVLFVSPMFLGGIGVHTAMKPGAWSFGQNTRFDVLDNPVSNFNRLRAGYVVYPFFIRELFEKDIGYRAALRSVMDVPLVRASYFILAGAGAYQGAVITRRAEPSFRHVNTLSRERWYLFQTNDDSFNIPFDLRRPAGQSSLAALPQASITPENIIAVMKAPPVYMTVNVLLFMMSPKSGDYCSILGPMVAGDDHSVHCPMAKWNVTRGAEPAIADALKSDTVFER